MPPDAKRDGKDPAAWRCNRALFSLGMTRASCVGKAGNASAVLGGWRHRGLTPRAADGCPPVACAPPRWRWAMMLGAAIPAPKSESAIVAGGTTHTTGSSEGKAQTVGAQRMLVQIMKAACGPRREGWRGLRCCVRPSFSRQVRGRSRSVAGSGRTADRSPRSGHRSPRTAGQPANGAGHSASSHPERSDRRGQ
jgi:hypothetical protein